MDPIIHNRNTNNEELLDNEEWEEWDGNSPFWIHCVAGSLAGVVEHTAVYPLDTVRTHIQVACSACAQLQQKNRTPTATTTTAKQLISSSAATINNPRGLGLAKTATAAASSHANNGVPMGMLQTIRHLMNEPIAISASAANIPTTTSTAAPSSPAKLAAQAIGWTRLWRGVQTMFLGCIPAHALYFSSYEIVKGAFLDEGQVSPLGSSLAGAAAVVSHDLIMTPLDTIKQRMQLGHYATVRSAFHNMVQLEGAAVFYRSFPVTLASNIPYGMIMVTVNEHLKQTLDLASPWKTVVVSSSCAGFVAAAATTPLDRIKTALQTQHLLPTCYGIDKQHCPKLQLQTHKNFADAAKYILETEGWRGFWRGMTPRVLSHTPAVAISWTTYETAKLFLMNKYS